MVPSGGKAREARKLTADVRLALPRRHQVAARRSHSYDKWQPAALTKKKFRDKGDRKDTRLDFIQSEVRRMVDV